MDATESTGRDGGQPPPASPYPLMRQLMRLMTAPCGRPAGQEAPAPGEESTYQDLDSVAVMELISAWHRRGTEVGFPELMPRSACGRRPR